MPSNFLSLLAWLADASAYAEDVDLERGVDSLITVERLNVLAKKDFAAPVSLFLPTMR
jgi:hypothetical protein